jgi:outer membrane beta-barrel protein
MIWQKAGAAELIDVPQEELATESVYPVFDKVTAVKNRNVTTAGRIDGHLFYGFAMTEPIANVSKLGLALYYNFNEDHSLGLLYAKNATGQSTYANQLDSQYQLDFARAPRPLSTYLLDYNIKAFYGKMSLTKKSVFNLSLFGTLAAGMVQYEHKSYPALVPGFGQKFYFDKNFALRFDLRLYVHQAPIPFLAGKLKKTDPVPQLSEFDERITYTTNLDVGLSYLF